MSLLAKKKILLGVTGGIAIYKSASLLRRLTHDYDCEVQVVMTQSALAFMTPLVFETFSGCEVITHTFKSNTGIVGTRHIDLVKSADCLAIIPATGNIISKIANGIADDELSTMMLVADPAKTVIAPAMNENMYLNPHIQANLSTIKKNGYYLIDPENGPLATDIEGNGIGRLPETDTLLFHLEKALYRSQSYPLQGKKILVTGGPTREFIDDIRFISNPSTGKMGVALAESAAKMGAKVTYITGPSSIKAPCGSKTVTVSSAAQMKKAVLDHFASQDAVIMSAAVEDMTPSHSSTGKIKKDLIPDRLSLAHTDDILSELGKIKKHQHLTGFSVEVENEIQHSIDKLTRKNLDLIVVNNPQKDGAGFGTDTNKITLIDREKEVRDLNMMSKQDAADHVLMKVIAQLHENE